MDEQGENHYQNSVIQATAVTKPEELIDKDLILLLQIVRDLKEMEPPEIELQPREVNFGNQER